MENQEGIAVWAETPAGEVRCFAVVSPDAVDRHKKFCREYLNRRFRGHARTGEVRHD